jgi:hypothetical protein
MFADARLKLPLWKTVPFFKHIFHFFDRLLGGGRTAGGAGEGSTGSVKVLADPRDKSPRAPRREPAAMHSRTGENLQESRQMPEGGAEPDRLGPYAVPEIEELEAVPAREDELGGSAGDDQSIARRHGKRSETRAPAAANPTAKQRAAAYKKVVEELAEKVIGKNRSIDARLKELEGKWNPLFAEKPKRNLVEDVNSFVRDQVRVLRRSVLKKPPDLERVENLALQISENEVFEEIKRKDEFREYIELYLIKVLGKV